MCFTVGQLSFQDLFFTPQFLTWSFYLLRHVISAAKLTWIASRDHFSRLSTSPYLVPLILAMEQRPIQLCFILVLRFHGQTTITCCATLDWTVSILFHVMNLSAGREDTTVTWTKRLYPSFFSASTKMFSGVLSTSIQLYIYLLSCISEIPYVRTYGDRPSRASRMLHALRMSCRTSPHYF